MYKLYNVRAWGSLCVHFLLEEMEIPYTNIWLTADQVRADEYRTLSPTGLIPALGLQDGRTLFESAAIVTFLLTAHPAKGLSPLPGSDDFGEFLSWLHFLSTNVYPNLSLGFPGSIYAATPEHDAHVVAAAIAKSQALLAVVEQRLVKDGPWLMGKDFSALDIYAFMLLLWCKPSEQAALARFPRLASLAARVRARPKLTAALEAHGVMQPGGYGT